MADSQRFEQPSPASERASEAAPKAQSLAHSLLDLGKDFIQTVGYSGLQSPVNGIAQLVDHVTGTNLLEHIQLIEPLQQAKFGSAKWHVEQLAGAVGLAVPMFYLHRGLEGMQSRTLQGTMSVTSTDVGLTAARLSSRVSTATMSGALYGGLLTPSNAEDGEFWQSRLKQAALDGAAFGAMSALNSVAAGFGRLPLLRGTRLQGLLESRIVSGITAGAGGGVVSSELHSLLNGNGSASSKDLLTSAYGYAFVGGIMGGMHDFQSWRSRRTAVKPVPETAGVDVVFGAGAMRGFGELGFLRYLEDQNIKISTATGASFGSLIAALHTNGYTAEQSKSIIVEQFRDIGQSVHPNGKLTHPWRALSSHFVDLKPRMQAMVEKYDLKPNEQLRILAYNLSRREPVIFEGTNYDLATALAASAALPGVMRAVRYRPNGGELPESMQHKGILVDGGLYRMTPAEFAPGPAIVAKATVPHHLPPLTLKSVFHIRRTLSSLPERLLVKSNVEPQEPHIVVAVGKPDVNSRDFNVTDTTLNEMLAFGYDQAQARLHEAISQGKLPIKRRL